MRFLHTSDWHLGRSFHGAGLRDAHQVYLDHLVEVVEQERVDAVLVAGDIYDRALPSVDAVSQLSDTLRRLVSVGAQVVLSGGNHDSATRLGFAAEVLELAGVHVRTSATRLTEPVRIAGVDIYPVPYLEPAFMAERLGAAERTHAAVLRAVTERILDQRSTSDPAVVMAHAFVAGATSSDSERDVTVGGLGVVPASVFDGFGYAALGHLHRPQTLSDRVRYAGSPVALSFSEASHRKQSLLVDLASDGLTAREIAAPVHRPLARLSGTLEELLSDPRHTPYENAWVEATLTDVAERPMERLRLRFPHCVSLQLPPPRGSSTATRYGERTKGRSDLQLCCDFVEHVVGRSAAEAEHDLLSEALARSAEQRRIADAELKPDQGADDSSSEVATDVTGAA